MKTFARKFLSVTLATMMLLSMLPTMAFAANSSDDFYRIVHLDNGRKYYSKEWIIALINEMAEAGFNQLQLAFGNDGMRFLLDDMKITVDGTTYSSAAVKEGIQKGNAAYYDEDVNELTESEMDEIIVHAKSKNIEIVPHMNMPGHMDAILDAIEYVGISDAHFTGYTTSVRSLNLNNSSAVNFTLALLSKYVDYFAGKDCKFFHIGADEFGNDAYGGGMGFPSMGRALYAKFADFVNNAAAIVKDADMTPRAWNDGISYGNGNYQSTTNYSEEFDTDIQVTYWSSGWGSGYAVAPASTLAKNGHDMINTHGSYYYILGVNDIYTAGETTNHVGYDYTAAKGFKNTTFMGTSGLEGVGSMFCIWGDNPGAETEQEVAKYVRPILRVMGARMNDSYEYEVGSIVSGGFNADGSINEGSEIVDPEVPVMPEDVAVPAETKLGTVTITAPGLEEVNVSVTDVDSDDETAWLTYSISVSGQLEEYTDLKFKVPYHEIFDECDLDTLVAYVDGDEVEDLAIEEDETGKYFVGTAPHFSDLTIRANAMPVADVGGGNVTLEIGGVKEDTLDGHVGTEGTYTTDDGVASYTIAHNTQTTAGGTSVTKVNSVAAGEYILGDGTTWLTLSGNTIRTTENAAEATLFTVASSGSGWTIKSGRYYLAFGGSFGNRTLITNTSESVWNYSNGFYQTVPFIGSDIDYYITSNGGVSYDSDSKALLHTRTTTTGTSTTSTTVTITGLKPGTTTVTVGDAEYEVTVKYNTETINLYVTHSATRTDDTITNHIVESGEGVEVSVNGNQITFKGNKPGTMIVTAGLTRYTINVTYKTASVRVPVGQSVTPDAQENKIEGTPVYANGGDAYVTAVTSNNSITFTGKAVGTTTVTAGDTQYSVEVYDVSLDDVAPLTIEYWITNKKVTIPADSDTVSMSVSAAASGIYSENGVDITALAPASDGAAVRPKVYWKSVCLPYGSHQVGSDDSGEAGSGVDMTDSEHAGRVLKIRYWTEGWEYFDGAEWVAIKSNDQIVAYYMQKTDVTVEIETNVVDWGEPYSDWKAGTGETWFWDGYVKNGSKYVFLDFAVVYEDGTQNPASFPTDNTWFLHFDKCSATNPRVLQPMRFIGNETYEIWKVTVTDGTSTGYSSASRFVSTYYDDTETVVWDESMDTAPSIQHLTYTANRSGKLVRIYVRTKVVVEADALHVHYVDQSGGNVEFYSYDIAAEKDKTFFHEDIGMGTDKNTLVNNTVVNVKNVTQTVSAELTTMPEIKAYYRYCDFTLVAVERSVDGKDVYLYYTFTPTKSFVIDFGLPIQIKPTDLNQVGYSTAGSDIEDVRVIGSYDTEASDTATAEYGNLSVSDTTVTYTPTATLMGTDFFTVFVVTALDDVNTTDKNEEAGIAYRVYIHPASNVLYEEGFMKPATTGDYQSWSGGSYSTDSNNAQSVSNEAEYGYDASYEGSVGVSGTAWTATVTSGERSDGTVDSASRMTEDLTVSFYGNGFDLIGTCAPNSGYIFMSVVGQTSGIKKGFVIDASHSQKTLHQVPLAHLGNNDLTELDTYKVTIFGSYRGGADLAEFKNTVSSVKVIGVKAKEDGTTETVSEIVSVEKLDAYLEELESSKLASAYIGNTIEIDGFRVYGDTNNALYKEAGTYVETAEKTVYKEYGLVYSRALAKLGDGFIGYIDGTGKTGEEYTVANYEKSGGPQNEIYLEKNQHVALAVTENATVQISLRGVEGATTAEIAGATTSQVPISHTTEMYYTVTASADGLITISNVNTDSDQGTGMLAVCNIKCMPTTSRLLRTADYGAVFMLLASEPVFTPEKMEVEAGTLPVLRKQVTTLTVTTSTDVKYLEVNGKKVKPSNSWMVKRGIMDEYVFVVTKTSNRNTEVSFDIVAYDEDGLASEVYSVIA